MKYLKVFLLCCTTALLLIDAAFAQSYAKRLQSIDVQKYTLSISVNDSSDFIEGTAVLDITFLKDSDSFSLDLTSVNEDGKGMLVGVVLSDETKLRFDHTGEKLTIYKEAKAGETKSYTIYYSGVPANGLIISKNKFGDRTFFGDNWPNRAHHWFPSVDHPSDKAYFTFIVNAPNYYQVVANGELKEEINISDDLVKYRWETSVPLPTKVAVIGIARFAVQNVKEINGIEVSTWVYPQNATDGFYDYQPAADILNFFIDYIGPYPYKKLANVQSKTMFGGMENASNIFYFENSVNGEQSVNSLLAHEIAHQWFGNSASESDWAHLWLSEGFATYMTNIYIQQMEGEDAFRDGLRSQRERVIGFYKQAPSPVVNTSETNYMSLLNANSYQKGGWFLHMLRNKIGENDFHRVIQTYYDRFKLSNASTEDFKMVAEEVSGLELDSFFEQWLYKMGQPELKITKQYSEEKTTVTVEQIQKSGTIFTFPLELEFKFKDADPLLKSVEVTQQIQSFEFSTPSNPTAIIPDPNVKLLFEEIE